MKLCLKWQPKPSALCDRCNRRVAAAGRAMVAILSLFLIPFQPYFVGLQTCTRQTEIPWSCGSQETLAAKYHTHLLPYLSLSFEARSSKFVRENTIKTTFPSLCLLLLHSFFPCSNLGLGCCALPPEWRRGSHLLFCSVFMETLKVALEASQTQCLKYWKVSFPVPICPWLPSRVTSTLSVPSNATWVLLAFPWSQIQCPNTWTC